jgi:hypothetical protein
MTQRTTKVESGKSIATKSTVATRTPRNVSLISSFESSRINHKPRDRCHRAMTCAGTQHVVPLLDGFRECSASTEPERHCRRPSEETCHGPTEQPISLRSLGMTRASPGRHQARSQAAIRQVISNMRGRLPTIPYCGRAWVQKDRQDCGFRRRRREGIGMSEFSAYLEDLSRVVQLNAEAARVRVAVNKQGNAVILS